MLRSRAFWVRLILLLALLAGGGYAYYDRVYRPAHTVEQPTILTAEVRRGDLIVSVSGSGTLTPASATTRVRRSTARRLPITSRPSAISVSSWTWAASK